MIEKVKDILENLLEKYITENEEEFLTEVSGSNHYSLWFSEENMKVVAATMVSDNWTDQTRDICLFRKKSGHLDIETEYYENAGIDYNDDEIDATYELFKQMLNEGELEEYLGVELKYEELEEHARDFGEDLFKKIFVVFSTEQDELISVLQDKVEEAWEEAEIEWNTLKTEKHDEELTKQLFGNINTWNFQKLEDLREACLMDQSELEKLCRFAKIAQDLEDNEERIEELKKVLTPAEAEIIVLRELEHGFLTLAEYLKVNTQTLRDRHSAATQKIKNYEHIKNDPEPFSI